MQLAGGQWTRGREPLELLPRGIRQADRPGFARFHEPAKLASGFLDRDPGVGGMQVEEVEPVGAQPPEALLHLGTDPLWPAVERLPAGWVSRGIGLPVNPALASDHD